MSKLNTTLVESEAKLLLEALMHMEANMADACATSTDEDEAADLGNDLVELRLLLNRLKAECVGAFGQSVLVFDRGSL